MQMLGRRVPMSAERSCQACHNRIGNKMFAVYPNGVLVSSVHMLPGVAEHCPAGCMCQHLHFYSKNTSTRCWSWTVSLPRLLQQPA